MNSKTGRTSIKHNNREHETFEKYANTTLDLSRSDQNVILAKKPIEQVYQEEFEPSLKKYNAKQKREDRKIENYLSHVRKLDNHADQYELIVQLGSMEDYWDKDRKERKEKLWKWSKEQLEEWFKGFKERNSNMVPYNAVIHMDEQTPHLHLNVVPIGSGYKRGLEKQVSMTKALKEQGFDDKDTRQAWNKWIEREREPLVKALEKKGIEYIRPGSNDLKNHKQYKAMKQQLLEAELAPIKRLKAKERDKLEEIRSEIADYEREVQNLPEPKKYRSYSVNTATGKASLKVPKGTVLVKESELDDLQQCALGERLKAAEYKKESERQEKENDNLQESVISWKARYFKLLDQIESFYEPIKHKYDRAVAWIQSFTNKPTDEIDATCEWQESVEISRDDEWER